VGKHSRGAQPASAAGRLRRRDPAQAADQSTALVLLQLASPDAGTSSGWMLSPLSHFQPHLAAPQISSIPALTEAQPLQLSQQDKIAARGVRLAAGEGITKVLLVKSQARDRVRSSDAPSLPLKGCLYIK